MMGEIVPMRGPEPLRWNRPQHFGLTRKQSELLRFIGQYIRESGGVPPAYSEMQSFLDLKSTSSIHRLITGLEERGFIRRIPGRARALEVVVRLPDNHSRETYRPTHMRLLGRTPDGIAIVGYRSMAKVAEHHHRQES